MLDVHSEEVYTPKNLFFVGLTEVGLHSLFAEKKSESITFSDIIRFIEIIKIAFRDSDMLPSTDEVISFLMQIEEDMLTLIPDAYQLGLESFEKRIKEIAEN